MQKYRLIVFSRQEFMCRDVFVEAVSAEEAAKADYVRLIAEDAWDDWGKEEYDSFAECYDTVKEGELYLVCAVAASEDFKWGNL